MALQRYDVEYPERPGEWRGAVLEPGQRPRSSTPDGTGVTDRAPGRGGHRTHPARGSRAGGGRARVLEAELYTRARELQEVNERLRQAHAREREVALALQQAMLPAPAPPRPPPSGRPLPARRRRPQRVRRLVRPRRPARATASAVAVGDVVGHGLQAAGVMGQLRSALSAASRVADGPPEALEVLGLYARSVEGARVHHRRPGLHRLGHATPSPTAAPATSRPPCCAPRRHRRVPRPGHRPAARRPPRTRPPPPGRHRLHRRRHPRPLHRRPRSNAAARTSTPASPPRRLPHPPPDRRPREPSPTPS